MNKTFDPAKPVQTREGAAVRIIDTKYLGAIDGRPILAVVTRSTTCEAVIAYHVDGRAGTLNDYDDLVNIPVEHTREVWLNIYSEGPSITHDTQHAARRAAVGCGCLAIVKVVVKFKEGDGL